MSHNFTASGAGQFKHDVHAISSLVERYIPDGSTSLGSLCDALQLLNLPVEGTGEALTLKKVTSMVFTDNAEAKKALDQLEIDSLTPVNARQILQRRVENAE
jgi:RAD50-interacting protein 1